MRARRALWPCERCGARLHVDERAGLLPRGALLLGLLGLTLLLFMPALAAPLFVATALWLRRAARGATRCGACGHRARARLGAAITPRPAVLIPAYDNGATILEVLRRVRQAAPQLAVIVVDDGSRDDTLTRAKDALAAATVPNFVIGEAQNRGKGSALRAGLKLAYEEGYTHVITLDADLQHHPEDIPRFRRALMRDEEAIIVGQRDLAIENVGLGTRLGRAFANLWLFLETGRRGVDSQSGFRVYPVATTLSLGARALGYAYESEVLVLAGRAGVPISSLPIEVHYPRKHERISHFRPVVDTFRIFLTNARLVLLTWLWPLGWPPRFCRRAAAWSGRSRGGVLGHAAMLACVRLGGRRIAYACARLVTLYFLLMARSSVRASAAFLDAASSPVRGRIKRARRAHRHLYTFAESIIDRCCLHDPARHGLRWKIEGEDPTRLQGGALLVSGHLGNYELAGALLAQSGRKVSVVMLDAERAVLKALHRRFGGDAARPEVISLGARGMPSLKVLAALRRGELVAMHGDRARSKRFLMCDFLGRAAPFSTAPFLLAAAARVPLVLVFAVKEGRDDYRIVIDPPRAIELDREESLAEHVCWYAGRLTAMARAHPLQWFNFYDFWGVPARDP